MQCPKCLRCPSCQPKSICNIDHCTGCRRGGGGRVPGAGQARLGPGRPLQDRPQRGGQPRQPAGRRGHGRAAGQSSHDSFFVYLPVFHTVTVRGQPRLFHRDFRVYSQQSAFSRAPCCGKKWELRFTSETFEHFAFSPRRHLTIISWMCHTSSR